MNKNIFCFLLAIVLFTCGAYAQEVKYDKALADSLGADDYGMKQYILVILKTGGNKTKDKDSLNHYFRGHLNNIHRLVGEGKLVLAGPFDKNDLQYRGIFILNVKTIDAAKTLLGTDPAYKAGIFDAELLPWYGPAALPCYIDINKKITRKEP
ncbi:hypothetical protein COR50_20420 [Chitinophaga caeni]|uniref:YCII-related domain-containing protein n=1 Tax=Chitinophaga caeni TaxID=2029983 RepID=A0A291QZK8_9BACT|nr:YciI family protein [Chitinophaga caeni]ATL49351.1 hypothetical protein COR50_20420 [Chitinophaga caeni]